MKKNGSTELDGMPVKYNFWWENLRLVGWSNGSTKSWAWQKCSMNEDREWWFYLQGQNGY